MAALLTPAPCRAEITGLSTETAHQTVHRSTKHAQTCLGWLRLINKYRKKMQSRTRGVKRPDALQLLACASFSCSAPAIAASRPSARMAAEPNRDRHPLGAHPFQRRPRPLPRPAPRAAFSPVTCSASRAVSAHSCCSSESLFAGASGASGAS